MAVIMLQRTSISRREETAWKKDSWGYFEKRGIKLRAGRMQSVFASASRLVKGRGGEEVYYSLANNSFDASSGTVAAATTSPIPVSAARDVILANSLEKDCLALYVG